MVFILLFKQKAPLALCRVSLKKRREPKAKNEADWGLSTILSGQTGVSSSELFFLSGKVSYFHGTSNFANIGFSMISKILFLWKIENAPHNLACQNHCEQFF
jgi:hypothetical protein